MMKSPALGHGSILVGDKAPRKANQRSYLGLQNEYREQWVAG